MQKNRKLLKSLKSKDEVFREVDVDQAELRDSWGKPNFNRTHCCALYIFPNMKPNYRTDSSYTYPFNHITISRQYRWEYGARCSRFDWGWLLLVVFYGKNSSWEDRSSCYGDIVRLGFEWKHWSEGFGKIVLANWGGV